MHLIKSGFYKLLLYVIKVIKVFNVFSLKEWEQFCKKSINLSLNIFLNTFSLCFCEAASFYTISGPINMLSDPAFKSKL